MPAPVHDRLHVAVAIHEVTDRLVHLVTEAPDTSLRVPATPEWTVAQAFGHVATVAPRYIQAAHQQGEWTENAGRLPELNARQLASLPTLEPDVVAADLTATVATLTELVGSFGDGQPVFRFHGGARISADVALGILLGELVVHGHDIAEALRQPWPIDPHHVELIQQGLDPILPGWLDRDKVRGHTARYEVRLRDAGIHRFRFADGGLTMNPPAFARPDVVISADPSAFLLVVYKRRSQWPAILTGKLAAWGRKPWLAVGFASLFHRP